MIITFYFDPSSILPVQKYGGTQRIVYWLMKELVKLGHTVYCIGNGKSQLKNIGVTLIPAEQEQDWRLLIPKDTDILQLQQNTVDVDMPYLNTIHGNEKAGTVFPINTVFLSKNHTKRFHADYNIFNGIDFDEYPAPAENKQITNSYLFLANASWNVKNLRDCARACHSSRKHLYVSGKDRKVMREGFMKKQGENMSKWEGRFYRYFSSGLYYSFSPYIHCDGEIAQSQKYSFANKTDALLYPVRWNEPCAVAVLEALSLGLPVFASPYGCLPEMVPDFCGKICANYAEFKEAVLSGTAEYNAKDIRAHALKNFSSVVMAKNYEQAYEKILSGENLNRTQPYSDYEPGLLPF